MQENYKILGLTESATDEQIRSAYTRLKTQYREERFMEGERGNEAAKHLTQLETAYSEIVNSRRNVKDTQTDSYDFSGVEEALKKEDINKAQDFLDEFNDRNAEWHYLQSVVFYKKNWTNESKKQLEIAMNMEPTNKKYSEAYVKLKSKIEYSDKQFKSGNADFSGQSTAGTEKQMGGDSCSSAMDFCSTMCCMNMLCNCCCSR